MSEQQVQVHNPNEVVYAVRRHELETTEIEPETGGSPPMIRASTLGVGSAYVVKDDDAKARQIQRLQGEIAQRVALIRHLRGLS